MNARLLMTSLTIVLAGCTTLLEFTTPPEDAGPKLLDVQDAGCGAPDDPKNCGSCGHSCLGGSCAGGACLPVVLASGQGDSRGAGYYEEDGGLLTGPDRIATDGTKVYWLDLRGEVMSVPASGGATVRLTTTPEVPVWIEVDADHVYFAADQTGLIYRVPKAGGTPEPLIPPGPAGYAPQTFVVSGGRLVWADGRAFYQCPTSGCRGKPDTLGNGMAFTIGGDPYDVAVAGDGTMFVALTHPALPELDAGNLDIGIACGTPARPRGSILAPSTDYYELQADTDSFYALSDNAILRGSCSGVVGVTFLASGENVPVGPRGLALDDAYVYWVQPTGATTPGLVEATNLERCAKTGCAAPEVLVANEETARAIAVDSVAVYWTTGDGKVKKLAKPAAPTTAMK